MAKTSLGFVRPLQPFKSFKRHILSASLTIAIFSIIAVVAAWYTKPLYEAKALIFISSHQTSNLQADSSSEIYNYQSFVENQIYMMYSYNVLNTALLSLGDTASMWNEVTGWKGKLFFWKKGGPSIALDNLKNALVITRLDKSNMVGISLMGDSPNGLAETVNAVAKAYIERVNGEGVEGKDDRIANLTRRRRELYSKMRDLSARKAKIAEGMGITATDVNNEQDPFRQQVDALHGAVYDAGIASAKAKAAYGALEKTINSYDDNDIRKMAELEAEKNELLNATYSALLEQKVSLQSVVNNMKPNHPKRQRLQKELEMREKEYTDLRQKIIDDGMGKIRRQLAARLEQAKSTATEAAQLEEELTGKMDQMKERMQRYNSLYDQAQSINIEMERIREQLVSIDNKLDMFDTEENAPGAIKIRSIARYPELPDNKNRLKVFVALFFIGMLFGIGVPCLLDAFNPWVMTPSDVFLAVSNPPLGCILEHGDEMYKDLARDQLRRLALTINAKAKKDNLTHFEFTSAKAGGGSTELSILLCNELSHIGVKTLLVEANIFKPDARYGGLDRLGFIDILRDSVPIKECIIPADPENKLPDRIRAGNIKGENLLPTKADWAEHYKEIAGVYDIIIYDTPPVLLSADAEMMSRFCDATLLVIEAEGVTFFEMLRALSGVKSIAANIGIVMNRAVVYPESGYYKDLLEEYGGGGKQKNGFISRLLLREGRTREVRRRGEHMMGSRHSNESEASLKANKIVEEHLDDDSESDSIEVIDVKL